MKLPKVTVKINSLTLRIQLPIPLRVHFVQISMKIFFADESKEISRLRFITL